jgi:hypothetical protein
MKDVRNIISMRKKSKYGVIRIKKAVVYDGNVTLLPHSASISKSEALCSYFVRILFISNVCSMLLSATARNE